MIAQLRKEMPPEGRAEVYHVNAKSADLRSDLEKDFPLAVKQTKTSAELFRGATMQGSAAKIHKFLRENIIYLKDDDDNQLLKAPSQFINDLSGDCKSYSQFAGAIIFNLGFNSYNKYASYLCAVCGPKCKCGKGSPNFPTPSHVYVIVGNENNYVTLDGTNPVFNEEREPDFFILKNLREMKVTSLSGNGERLADETLSAEAAKSFYADMARMTPGERQNFLKQFSAYNQNKLIVALRSVAKMEELNNCDTTYNSKAILFSNPPGMWETWGQRMYKYNSPYARRMWGNGMNISNMQFLAGDYGQQYMAKDYGQEYMAGSGENLAGRIGEKIKDFFKKIGSALAKPFLAPFRGAFLALLKLIPRLREKFQKVWWKPPYNGREKITNVWEGFGGEMSIFLRAAEIGNRPPNEMIYDETYIVPEDLKKALKDAYGDGELKKVQGLNSWIYFQSNGYERQMTQADFVNVLKPAITISYNFTPEMMQAIAGRYGIGSLKQISNGEFIWLRPLSRDVYLTLKNIFDLAKETGLSGVTIGATMALASTILGGMLAAIMPFLDEEDSKEASQFSKDGKDAEESEEGKSALEKVSDWIDTNADSLVDTTKDVVDKIEDLFSNGEMPSGSGSGGGGGSGSNEESSNGLMYGLLAAAGLFFLSGKKSK